MDGTNLARQTGSYYFFHHLAPFLIDFSFFFFSTACPSRDTRFLWAMKNR